RYDANRRVIGIVGPDPDGAGPLKNRATSITYTLDGLVSAITKGTVNSQSDPDWANLAPLQQIVIGYDSLDRRILGALVAGGAVQMVAQYSYDSGNRLSCAALRMNPSALGNLPSSACALGTTGVNGPDRITHYTYDNANRTTVVTNGYASGSPIDVVTQAYNPNGTVRTVADGKGNLTTFKYDGVDRLSQTFYPNPANGSVSSTTDYEQLTYDAASHITQDRRRDGQTITYTLDHLGRVTTGVNSATYAYDNFSRLTSATLSSKTITFGYDQLSRKTSEGGPLGTETY